MEHIVEYCTDARGSWTCSSYGVLYDHEKIERADSLGAPYIWPAVINTLCRLNTCPLTDQTLSHPHWIAPNRRHVVDQGSEDRVLANFSRAIEWLGTLLQSPSALLDLDLTYGHCLP